ncbi:FAD binding domain-containing protein [Pseudonocardia acidicola]|uniref:Xanthine dehydrogenase family protein subunit M n=1 Tax=Pseudonocardia acidicola TaxID=2724939 RepID=A0ABX1S9M2_9PSEU|nr:xanthine dehydrogenase family protein subunit M [Pseudonocardia acidicola]
MRTATFEFTRAASLDEALAAMATGAQALAGGQSLVQTMKLRQAAPAHLVDINGVDDLRGLASDGDGLRIGALTRIAELASSPDLARHCPWLQDAARRTADVQVRNRGTIGGNLCFADPRSNLASTLISLRAELTVRSRGGTRRLGVEELFAGFRRNTLAAGELVTAVHVPGWAPAARGAYRELSRQPNGVPVVNVAVTVNTDGVVGIGVGGLGMRPLRALQVEEALRTVDRTDPDAVRTAAGRLADDLGAVEPLTDLHGSAEYRLDVATALLRRLVVETARTEES